MSTDIWQKACVIVGVWKEGERCDSRASRLCGEHFKVGSHDIPCPPVGEPAAVVKMLEWLVTNEGWANVTDGHYGGRAEARYWTVNDCKPQVMLPVALAAAIVALEESKP